MDTTGLQEEQGAKTWLGSLEVENKGSFPSMKSTDVALEKKDGAPAWVVLE